MFPQGFASIALYRKQLLYGGRVQLGGVDRNQSQTTSIKTYNSVFLIKASPTHINLALSRHPVWFVLRALLRIYSGWKCPKCQSDLHTWEWKWGGGRCVWRMQLLYRQFLIDHLISVSFPLIFLVWRRTRAVLVASTSIVAFHLQELTVLCPPPSLFPSVQFHLLSIF